MKTLRVLISMLLGLPLVGVACSDTVTAVSTGSGVGGAGDDASQADTSSSWYHPPQPPPMNGDCYRDDRALLAKGSAAETGKMDCTAAQIDAFFTACFDGGDCDAFRNDMANEACLGCVLGETGEHFPPLLLGNDIGGGSIVYINLRACESIAQALPQCAAPTSGYEHCVDTACETCQSVASDEACIELATAPDGICTTGITVPAECAAILDVETMDLSPECAGTDFASLYQSAANYICGAGAN